ncbi:unnamed protein product [Haemonchus placei]|uniref:HECT domain-containing protein n=1 Tax=Haemonchus placei TaxID=6290 RepID=A0A0N4W0W7_HAEPC|nr:unnamed protein product [Haemonchus placei]
MLSNVSLFKDNILRFLVHLPEGLCSPPDLNLTPPGIVTKLDAFHRPKINWRLSFFLSAFHLSKMTGERLLCLCCSKKNQCFCKKCTLEKLKFYSRKENISIRSTRKSELEKEVDSMLGETVSFKFWLSQYFSSCRYDLFLLNSSQLEFSRVALRFLVRDNFLSDGARERLGAALSDSLLNLTTELRSPFAAFLLSLQLVNNMATIFDFRLPYLLSYRDVSLRERWSRELLDNDWFKFCQSVLSLGLQLGMPPESLHFNYPHANIIEQTRFVLEGALITTSRPVCPTTI